MKEEKASDTDRVTYRVQQHKDSEQMHSVTLYKYMISSLTAHLFSITCVFADSGAGYVV